MPRYIRAKQLEQDYGIDRVTAWRWAHDPERNFPKPTRMAQNLSVYDALEIENWFAAHLNKLKSKAS